MEGLPGYAAPEPSGVPPELAPPLIDTEEDTELPKQAKRARADTRKKDSMDKRQEFDVSKRRKLEEMRQQFEVNKKKQDEDRRRAENDPNRKLSKAEETKLMFALLADIEQALDSDEDEVDSESEPPPQKRKKSKRAKRLRKQQQRPQQDQLLATPEKQSSSYSFSTPCLPSTSSSSESLPFQHVVSGNLSSSFPCATLPSSSSMQYSSAFPSLPVSVSLTPALPSNLIDSTPHVMPTAQLPTALVSPQQFGLQPMMQQSQPPSSLSPGNTPSLLPRLSPSSSPEQPLDQAHYQPVHIVPSLLPEHPFLADQTHMHPAPQWQPDVGTPGMAAGNTHTSTEQLGDVVNDKIEDSNKQSEQADGSNPHCVCGATGPYDESRFFIQCDACDGWFHGECVGITPEQATEIKEYVCPVCRRTAGRKTA